jgi:periplasmic copper chaperone A
VKKLLGYFAIIVTLLVLPQMILPLLPARANTDEIQLVEVECAWMRHNAMAGRPSAIYLKIVNYLGIELKLVEVTSPIAERIIMHEVSRYDNRVEMLGLAYVLIAPEAETSFSPGERHMMVFGIDPGIKVGDTVPVTLHFDDGMIIPVEVKVCGLMATGMC